MKVLARRLALLGSVSLFVLLLASTSAAAAASFFTDHAASQEEAAVLVPPSFDESVARHVVKLTEAAYCTAELAGWNCTVCHSFPGMRNVTTLQGQSRNVRGFIGVDTGTAVAASSTSNTARRRRVRALEQGNTAAATAAKAATPDGGGMEVEAILASSSSGSRPRPRIVVTFSGTDPKSIKNWIDDLEAAPIAHAYEGGGCDNCKVHRGFLAAYDVVQDQVLVGGVR